MTLIVSGSPGQKETRGNGFKYFSSREFRNDENGNGFRRGTGGEFGSSNRNGYGNRQSNGRNNGKTYRGNFRYNKGNSGNYPRAEDRNKQPISNSSGGNRGGGQGKTPPRLRQLSAFEGEEGKVNIVRQSGMNSGQLKW